MDTVIRTGKIFEVGNFEDKSFAFSESDLEHAVSSFKPVPVDLEHIPTVLEGKLGHVERIFSDDGKTLMGEVHLPPWLDTLLEDGQRKVSATWDRASKQLLGLALVRSPRVSDAALMAAFSAESDIPADLLVLIESLPPSDKVAFAKHNTSAGQGALQMLHNVAADRGAVCNKPASMASRHESSAVQQIHDIAQSHGAKCESIQPGQSMPAAYSNDKPRSKKMGLRESLKEIFAAQGSDVEDAELDVLFSREADPKVAELETALKEANDRAAALETSQKNQDAQFARINDDRRHQDAVAFANKQIAEGRLPAAAASALVPLAESIARHESTVQFAEGEATQSTLLDAFMQSLGEAFAIFGKSVVPSTKVEAMFSQETTPGVGEAEAREDVLKKMRAATPAGRQIDKDKQNGNHA